MVRELKLKERERERRALLSGVGLSVSFDFFVVSLCLSRLSFVPARV